MTTINFNGKLFNRLFGLCVAWTLKWIWLEHDDGVLVLVLVLCVQNSTWGLRKNQLSEHFVIALNFCHRRRVPFCGLQFCFNRFKNKINRRSRFVWLRQAATVVVNQPPKIPFVSRNFKIASKMQNEFIPKVHTKLNILSLLSASPSIFVYGLQTIYRAFPWQFIWQFSASFFHFIFGFELKVLFLTTSTCFIARKLTFSDNGRSFQHAFE